MKPDFALSTQTLALIDSLRTASIGGMVSYAAMTETIGDDIVSKRHVLATALRHLQSDGVIFGTVRGEGIKRLAAEEIPSIGDAAVVKIGRAARRARRRMSVIGTMNDVPNEVRVRVNASASLLGAIEHFSTRPATAKATEAVTKAGGVIPPARLLDALK